MGLNSSVPTACGSCSQQALLKEAKLVSAELQEVLQEAET